MPPRPRNHCGWKLPCMVTALQSRHSQNLLLSPPDTYSPISQISSYPYQNTFVYIVLMTSQLTYCTPLWRPHLIKNVLKASKASNVELPSSFLCLCFWLQNETAIVKTLGISHYVLLRATGYSIPHQLLQRPTWHLHESKFCLRSPLYISTRIPQQGTHRGSILEKLRTHSIYTSTG